MRPESPQPPDREPASQPVITYPVTGPEAPPPLYNVPWWLVLLQGLVSILIGLMVLAAPASALLFLVRLLGCYWLIKGIFSLTAVFHPEARPHRGWLILNSVLGMPVNGTLEGGQGFFMQFYVYEFWRFVFVQQEVGKLALSAIEYPPMQKGASFNLDAVKAQIEAAIRNQAGK